MAKPKNPPTIPQMQTALAVVSAGILLLPAEARRAMQQVFQFVWGAEPPATPPTLLQVYRALGVLRRGFKRLPEDAQAPMRLVLRAVKQHETESRLAMIERLSILRRQRCSYPIREVRR